jgi:hypothetical protein
VRIHLPQVLFVVAVIGAQAVASELPSKFDGSWSVTLSCPPHTERDNVATGYTHHFSGAITNGQLRAVHGTEGEPNWHLLSGTIASDGSAMLLLEGIVGELGGMNRTRPGKSYKYSVRAQFEPSSGTGERQTGRVCHFTFSREPPK